MKFVINKISVKEAVSKKTGRPYKTYWISGSDGNNYKSFVGKWNQDWKIGQEVEVEASPAAFTGKDGNLVNYFDIKTPGKSGGGFGNEMTQTILGNIAQTLLEIRDELRAARPAQEIPAFDSSQDIPF